MLPRGQFPPGTETGPFSTRSDPGLTRLRGACCLVVALTDAGAAPARTMTTATPAVHRSQGRATLASTTPPTTQRCPGGLASRPPGTESPGRAVFLGSPN